MKSEPRILSYGGGVQSVALLCLIRSGQLPTPDMAVIADTGREATTTWDYLREVSAPLAERLGFVIHVAPHSLASVDLYSKNGSLLIPAYTTANGKVGQMPGYCSVEWKRRVVRRYLRQQGVESATLWLGISCDEAHRAKDSDVGWLRHEYPLLSLNLKRRDCERIIQDSGLPVPNKSSCWMCPYRGPEEWRALTANDWQLATTLDAEIRQIDPLAGISKSGKPLSEWDRLPDAQGKLTGCEEGYCWT